MGVETADEDDASAEDEAAGWLIAANAVDRDPRCQAVRDRNGLVELLRDYLLSSSRGRAYISAVRTGDATPEQRQTVADALAYLVDDYLAESGHE